MRRALELCNRAPRRAEIALYLAWSLDVQRRRAEARELYATIRTDAHADRRTRARAELGRWRRMTGARAARLPVDTARASIP
jgi:thioredoxin-like negative regulator of GroEL